MGYAFPLPHDAARGEARLVVKRRHAKLIDKRVMVLGKRQADGAPSAFGYVRLSYDNAFGGPGFDANPLGSGHGATANCAPPLLDAYAPEHAVACFAPIPSVFPKRRARLKGMQREQLDEALDLPDDFDWDYFQAAPSDQQLEELAAGDEFRIEGMRVGGGSIRFSLPRFAAHAHLQANGSSQARELPLTLDQLHIDAHRRRATMVWRTSVAIDSPAQLHAMNATVEVTMLAAPAANATAPPPETGIASDAAARPVAIDASPVSRTADTPGHRGAGNSLAQTASAIRDSQSELPAFVAAPPTPRAAFESSQKSASKQAAARAGRMQSAQNVRRRSASLARKRCRPAATTALSTPEGVRSSHPVDKR